MKRITYSTSLMMNLELKLITITTCRSLKKIFFSYFTFLKKHKFNLLNVFKENYFLQMNQFTNSLESKNYGLLQKENFKFIQIESRV
jgi:hypothetical protein